MHGLAPKPFNAKGQLSAGGLMSLAMEAAKFGISGGFNDTVSAQGITPKPQIVESCFAIVDDFFENQHAWTEADLSDPSSPVRMNGGRRGLISGGSGGGSGGGIDDQVAWGLNGESYYENTVIYIVRINYNAWGIVGGLGSGGSGSGSPAFTVDCAAGTIVIH